MLPSEAMNGGGMRGTKKPGTPKVTADAALRKLNSGRMGSSDASGMNDACADMRSQNSRSRSTPRSGGLPAISAALIAPIDTSAIQSGASPTSVRPAYTPAWYAPRAPPPCNTRTVWSNLPKFTAAFEGGVLVLVFIAYPRQLIGIAASGVSFHMLLVLQTTIQ